MRHPSGMCILYVCCFRTLRNLMFSDTIKEILQPINGQCSLLLQQICIYVPFGSILIICIDRDKVTVSSFMWQLFSMVGPLVTLLETWTLLGLPLQWISLYLHLNGTLMTFVWLVHNQVRTILIIYGNTLIILFIPPNVSIWLTGY